MPHAKTVRLFFVTTLKGAGGFGEDMPYWRVYYHIVWAVKGRRPLISNTVEAILFPAIEAKVRELRAQYIAINGTEDHIHLLVSIPPSISVADFVARIKGSTVALYRKMWTPILVGKVDMVC